MAIQDSDPERRNLVITSMAFIIYFIAGGKPASDVVRLQVININFNHPEVLAVVAWVLLFWFFIRYWQTHQEDLNDAYLNHLNGKINSRLAAFYIKHKYKMVPFPEISKPGTFRDQKLDWSDLKKNIKLSYSRVDKFSRNGASGFRIESQKNIVEDKITGKYKVLVKLILILSFAIRTPGVTSYLAPYVIFVMALLSPLTATFVFYYKYFTY